MSNDTERHRLGALLAERALFRESVVLASGRRSDYYLDVRQVLLDPEGAHLAGRLAYPLLATAGPRAVGGLTLGADPLVCAVSAAAYADGTHWTGFFVRKEAKKHGLQHWLEGPFVEEGTPVAVVDDVLTSGGSMLTALERARATAVLLAIHHHQRRDHLRPGRAAVEAELGGAPLHALFTAQELLAL
jgi:orotate phosphoribosyltransferase